MGFHAGSATTNVARIGRGSRVSRTPERASQRREKNPAKGIVYWMQKNEVANRILRCDESDGAEEPGTSGDECEDIARDMRDVKGV